jgi:hypothetical protein
MRSLTSAALVYLAPGQYSSVNLLIALKLGRCAAELSVSHLSYGEIGAYQLSLWCIGSSSIKSWTQLFMVSFIDPAHAVFMQARDAESYRVQQAADLAATLREKVKPFFLRREKSSTEMVKVSEQLAAGAAAGGTAGSSAPPMPQKDDFIVWLRLHPFQRVLYTVCLLPLFGSVACFTVAPYSSSAVVVQNE